MKVASDYICEHEMPQPWATCTDCMMKPFDVRPEGPRPPPEPPKPKPRVRGSNAMPESADDRLPKLGGDKDLSYSVHDFDEHRNGPGNDWLFATGGFPAQLRAGGWLYLRADGRLGPRVRVRGIGFREERLEHTFDPEAGPENRGPGPTIELDAETWEDFDLDLGDLASKQRTGYRYLITDTDGGVHHLMATESAPVGVTVDPPMRKFS